MTKRATGANVALTGAFETAYGQPPGGNFQGLRAYAWSLSAAQELLDEPLLGAGRDPLDPGRGAIDVRGTAEVPVDQRMIGVWLKGLLGAAQSATVIGARGHVQFAANPAAGDTVTLDGTSWEFVAAGPVGNQTAIAADLGATVAQLAADLNGSADAAIAAASYGADGNRLVVEHDTADSSGDGFTLAASAASVSAATLVGGGLTRHVWHTGAATLPSLTVETEHKDLDGERFYAQHGIMVNGLTIPRSRAGAARATLDLIAQSETTAAASIAGAPTQLAVDLFSQFHGVIRVDGVGAVNLTGGDLGLSNNLDVAETLRDDGLIGGADPGATALTFSLTARFSDTALRRAAESATPVRIDFGFYDPATGAELSLRAERVHLPKPSREIGGPGGISVTYEARGAQAVALGRAGTVTLINDVAGY